MDEYGVTKPHTFQYMAENAVDGSGLCDYCDYIPFTSHPTLGGVFCEGMGCKKAYHLYLNDFVRSDR